MNKKSAGFTTIELAMVMLIFGMVFLAVMTAFTYYNQQQTKAHTQEAFATSNAAILSFQAIMGYYPCPADPSIPRGGLGYGLEERDPVTKACVTNGDVTQVTNPGVNQYKDPANPNEDDPIFIGAVPFNTIIPVLNDPDGIPGTDDDNQNTIPIYDRNTYDGWNHKLLYAVTGTLTSKDTYNDYYGAIRVADENDNSLVQEKETDTNGNNALDPAEDLNEDGILNDGQYAHFVILSHGENGRGAYASTGEVVEFCPPSLAIPANPADASAVSELENCDNDIDGKFLSGLLNNSDHSINDDLTKFTINETSGLWVYANGSADQIHNTNLGNVGFGEEVPSEKLEIEGNLRAQEVRADAYCDPTGSNKDCMNPDAIAGDLDVMKCPAGEAMVGLEQNAVNRTGQADPNDNVNRCAPIFSGVIKACTCAANCRVTGFQRDSNGDKEVICRHKTTNALCACN